jgi:hypothetical protein
MRYEVNYEDLDEHSDQTLGEVRDQIHAWYADAAERGGRIVASYVVTLKGESEIVFVGEFPEEAGPSTAN